MLQLTKLRQECGWSKVELGSRARVHPARVGTIENSRAVPPSDGVEVVRLALALDYRGDPGDLLEPVDEPTKVASSA